MSAKPRSWGLRARLLVPIAVLAPLLLLGIAGFEEFLAYRQAEGLVTLVPTADLVQASRQRSLVILAGLATLLPALLAVGLLQAREVAAREVALRQLAARTEELAQREAEAAALRELDRLQTEFLRTISHELRTPLTLVYGYAELLLTGHYPLQPPVVHKMVGQIAAGATELTRLVDDLLDFGHIERGEMTVQPVDCDLVPVLCALLSDHRGRPGGDRVASELPAQLPARVDPAQTAQVVSNLLANALKYAPRGPIVLRARQADRVVRVEVEDHGPGIPPEEQPRVWEKFYRGAGVAGLNVARGAGIGLAVVKALVEAQGGRVGLESTPSRGACFWFEVPAACRLTAVQPAAQGGSAPPESATELAEPWTGSPGNQPAGQGTVRREGTTAA